MLQKRLSGQSWPSAKTDPMEHYLEKTLTSQTDKSVCLMPKLEGLGGPTSFQAKLIQGLQKRGIQTHYNPADPSTGTILVIGGSKHLEKIWSGRRKGIRVVQRLNGMNWIHRKKKTGLKHYLRSEYGNFILSSIRKRLTDYIVYQSSFARSWWQTNYGKVKAPGTVIYNGVDLDIYSPNGTNQLPKDHVRVLLVEGHLGGGNEEGLQNAVALVEELGRRLSKKVELMVVGDVPLELRLQMESKSKAWITWQGVVKRADIPELDRSAHLLFSADLNAACPNSVIEALACGLPVVAFATGSLPELLEEDAGRVAPYGGNYWELEPADIPALADAAQEILNDLPYFRKMARKRAEKEFSLDAMVEAYLEILFPQ